MNNEK